MISSTVRTCHIVNICPNRKKVAIPLVGVKFWYSWCVFCDLAYLSLCIMLPTLNFLPSVDRKSTTVCWLYQSLLFNILELKENKHDELLHSSNLKNQWSQTNIPKWIFHTMIPNTHDPKLNHKKTSIQQHEVKQLFRIPWSWQYLTSGSSLSWSLQKYFWWLAKILCRLSVMLAMFLSMVSCFIGSLSFVFPDGSPILAVAPPT